MERRKFPSRVVAPFALFCAATLMSSIYHGAFHGEFGGHPDEAGHYVTGLMVHDYLVSGHYLRPLEFAENFYIHYPKVALGHWPPLFYVVEALWMVLFSPSRISLVFLTSTIAGCLGWAVYSFLDSDFGKPVSTVAGVTLCCLPLVQTFTGMVMTDILVSLLCFASAVYFGRFLETEASIDVLIFGLLAATAIMTKGSGIVLAFVPVFAILLTRKWRLWLRPALWGSAALVAILCGPWYWLTRKMVSGAFARPSLSLSYTSSAIGFYALHLFSALGGLMSLFAVIGLIATVSGFLGNRPPAGRWAAIMGLFFGTFVLCAIIPTDLESRYLLSAVPAGVVIAVAGVAYLETRFSLARFKPVLIVCAVCLVGAITRDVRAAYTPSFGFGRIAESILALYPASKYPVILVCSDANGEGMFISEFAMLDKRPGRVVLRGSKVLASSNWNGGDYRPYFQTVRETLHYLKSIPVDVVVLDDSVQPQEHQRLLQTALSSTNSGWEISAEYPVCRKGVEYPAKVAVYSYQYQKNTGSGIIRIDATRTLGRSLVFDLRDSAPSQPLAVEKSGGKNYEH